MNKYKLINLLENMLKFEDILACMLVRKGLEGIFPNTIKIKHPEVWTTLKKTTDQLFYFINTFYNYRLTQITFELGEYNIIIVPITEKSALLVIVPALSNIGLISVQIEKAVLEINNLKKERSE